MRLAGGGKAAAVAAALLAGALLAFFLANRLDTDLSPEARAYYESGRTPPLTTASGFALVIGLAAPVDRDPREFAVEWSEGIIAAGKAGKRYPEPKGGLKVRGAPELMCEPERMNCVERFRANPASVDDLAADNAVLLRRYAQLPEAGDLGDAGAWAAFDTPAAADFSTVLATQAVVLSSIAAQAGRGDRDGALARLETDAALYRRWLAESRVTVAKMVSLRALARDLLLAWQVAPAAGEATPAQRAALGRIARPLGKPELAMRRPLRFEAAAHFDSLDRLLADRAMRREIFDNALVADLVPWFTARNATLDFGLRPFASWERLDDVETGALWAEVDRVQREIEDLVRPGLAWLHNPGGKYLIALGVPAFAEYIVRVRDVDALARLVCAAAEARYAGVAREAVARHLEGAVPDCRDPWTGRPFAWDPVRGELSFAMGSRSKGAAERLGGANGRVALAP